MVEAGVVSLLVNFDPLGIVDPSLERCVWTCRESARKKHPSPLLACGVPDFLDNFVDVLILGVDDSDVVLPCSSKPHDIEGNSDIDPLLLGNLNLLKLAKFIVRITVAILQTPGGHRYTRVLQRKDPSRPIAMPCRVSSSIRHTCIKAHEARNPAMFFANCLVQSYRIVVWMMVAKCGFGVLEEVLAIDKRHGVQRTLLGHHNPPNKKPRRGPVRAKSSGELISGEG